MKSITESRFWDSWHSFYRQEAHERAALVAERYAAHEKELEALRQRIGTGAAIINALSARRQSLAVESMLIHLLACMSIEAFLNHYGVTRTGEEFFRKNCERLSPSQKTAVLLLAATGSPPADDAEILKLVRRMFELRNSFVHPKAKKGELNPRSARPSTTGWPERVTQTVPPESVQTMDRFFDLFAEADPEAKAVIGPA
jgi:hypothetical protein